MANRNATRTSTNAAASALVPTATDAQLPASRRAGRRRWALELHGGQLGKLLSAGSSSGDSIDAFAAGAPFTTAGGRPSRAVSSWLYGDGPLLFDQIRGSFAANYGVALPGIVSLDGVLRGEALTRGSTTTVGGRLSGALTSWLALELAYDRGSSRVTLDDGVASGIEASRASYVSAFQALLTTIPHTGGQVVATATPFADGGSRSTQIATASLVITPIRASRVGVHIVLGGGVVKNDGDPTEIRIQAGTRFSLLSQMPINESETITIRYDEKRQLPAIVAGAGFTVDVWGPFGLRADARVLATENTRVTTLSSSASHTTTLVTAQQVTFPSLTSPSIQFSSIPNVRTTLSGPPVDGLVTYSGKGYELRPQFTVGLVLRF